jgi:hypothetical protein
MLCMLNYRVGPERVQLKMLIVCREILNRGQANLERIRILPRMPGRALCGILSNLLFARVSFSCVDSARHRASRAFLDYAPARRLQGVQPL